MSVIYTIWLREMLRAFRSRARIVGSLAMPFLWLIVIGTGIGSFVTRFNYLHFIAPGIIGMSILFTSIFSGISVMWDRQFGFLKEMLVAPVSRTSIVVGKIAGSATLSVANGLIVFVIASLIGAFPVVSLFGIAAALLFMILIAAAFVSLGLLIASRLENMEGFQLIMSFLVMPTFFLSGAIFPLDPAPAWMRLLSSMDPLMYGVDGLRGALIGVARYPLWLDALVLFAFGAVLTILTSRAFEKMK